MKKFSLTLFIVIFGMSIAFSQPLSNLVFFSEDGYPFHVIMNGIKENPNAQTNVRITNLNQPAYKVKIIFEDQSIPSVEKNVYTKPDMEITYVIKKNKKGENILRFYSEAVRPYEEEIVNETPVEEEGVHTEIVVHEEAVDHSGGISIDVNVNESGINYNVETDEGSINVNANIDVNEPNVHYDMNVTEHQSEVYVEEGYSDHSGNVYDMPGYTGPIGCDWPMGPADFQRAKQTIHNADFDDDKLTIAKQVLGMNCLTVEQVKQIGMLLDFEDSRLEFAKFAWGRTFDQGNYYILNDMFDFSSSIEELNEYIQTH